MKIIEGYKGLYSISDDGKVFSHRRNKFLSHALHNGYSRLELTVNGIRKNMFVHRLVAEAYIQNLDNKPQVNHINGIKTDNRVANLEWCTRSENIQHMFDTGLYSHINEKNPRSKLNLMLG